MIGRITVPTVRQLKPSSIKISTPSKEVAKLAGLKEWQRVTAHTARRSFATNLYKRDFPTLMIMRRTGHQTEKAFLTYIKVTEDENAERMIKKFEEQEAQRQSTEQGK